MRSTGTACTVLGVCLSPLPSVGYSFPYPDLQPPRAFTFLCPSSPPSRVRVSYLDSLTPSVPSRPLPYSALRSEFVFLPHTQGIREALPASVFRFVPTFRPHPLFCYADRLIMIVPKCLPHRSFQDVADSIHAEIRRKHTVFSERKSNTLWTGCSPAQFDALARDVPRSFFHPIRVLPGGSYPHSTRAVLAPLAQGISALADSR